MRRRPSEAHYRDLAVQSRIIHSLASHGLLDRIRCDDDKVYRLVGDDGSHPVLRGGWWQRTTWRTLAKLAKKGRP